MQLTPYTSRPPTLQGWKPTWGRDRPVVTSFAAIAVIGNPYFTFFWPKNFGFYFNNIICRFSTLPRLPARAGQVKT